MAQVQIQPKKKKHSFMKPSLIVVDHHLYDLKFYLNREKCLSYIVWALYLDS